MEPPYPERAAANEREPAGPLEAPRVRGDVEVELERQVPPPLGAPDILKVLARAGVLFFRLSTYDGLTFLTPNVEKVLGYTREELVGDPDLVHKVVDPEFWSQLDRVAPSFFEVRGEAIRLEVPFVAKDGTKVRLEVRVLPEIAAHGAVTGFFGVAVEAGGKEGAAEPLRPGPDGNP